jgi:hypothetical protein
MGCAGTNWKKGAFRKFINNIFSCIFFLQLRKLDTLQQGFIVFCDYSGGIAKNKGQFLALNVCLNGTRSQGSNVCPSTPTDEHSHTHLRKFV